MKPLTHEEIIEMAHKCWNNAVPTEEEEVFLSKLTVDDGGFFEGYFLGVFSGVRAMEAKINEGK